MINQILKLFGIRVTSTVVHKIAVDVGSIDDETALKYGPFYRGIMTIAGDVSQLPLYVFKKNKEGRGERQDNHNIAKLLRGKINRYMTKQVFFELLQTHALLYGNGVAQIVKNRLDQVVQLIPLMPWHLSYEIQNGNLVYVYEPAPGNKIQLEPEDVIHIKGFSFDGLVGVPLYSLAQNGIKLGLLTEALPINFYENGATLSGVIQLPYSLSSENDIRRLKESWKSNYQGSKNAGKVAVLEQGAEFKPISPTLEDSQWAEGREFQKVQTSDWFLMPQSKFGGKSNFSSLEESNRDYLVSCLNRWLVKIEEELTVKLFSEDELEEGYYVEFVRNSLTMTTTDQRFNAYTKAIHYGVMCPNEVRALEGLPEYPDGNTFFSPVNVWPIDEERPYGGKEQKAEQQASGSSGDGKEGDNALKQGV